MTADHPGQEQIASAEAARTGLPHTGWLKSPALSPLGWDQKTAALEALLPSQHPWTEFQNRNRLEVGERASPPPPRNVNRTQRRNKPTVAALFPPGTQPVSGADSGLSQPTCRRRNHAPPPLNNSRTLISVDDVSLDTVPGSLDAALGCLDMVSGSLDTVRGLWIPCRGA